MVGIGALCVWSTVGGSRSVRELWHVDQCDVRAVAMVIFRAGRGTYTRGTGNAWGASRRSLPRELEESRPVL